MKNRIQTGSAMARIYAGIHERVALELDLELCGLLIIAVLLALAPLA